MQRMSNLGGSGDMPPERFEKLHPLQLNLGALLMIYGGLHAFQTELPIS